MSDPSSNGGEDTLTLDEVDVAIVEQLQNDGRRPFTTIARNVGMSEAAVRQRVQRMYDRAMLQIIGVVDPVAFGLRRTALLGVRVDGRIHDVAAALASLSGVRRVMVTAGSFDLFCEVNCRDDEGLVAIVSDEIRSLPGVRDTETFVCLERIASRP